MFSRDKLKNVTNILSLTNDNVVGIDAIQKILTAVEQGDDYTLLTTILELCNKDQDLTFLKQIFTAIRYNPEIDNVTRGEFLYNDVLDSFSDNQLKAKSLLVKHLDDLNLLNKDTEVVIWGCWYGSILIPLLHDKVKKITAIDTDDATITVAQNQLLPDDVMSNVEWIAADIFEEYKAQYNTADIFINTSCEHMRPMSEWGPIGPKSIWKDNKFGIPDKCYTTPWWSRVNKNAHFAFTSNNMFNIEGHINCVNTIEEFKLQLPEGAEVLTEDKVSDLRGTRYMLIGKLNSNKVTMINENDFQ